MAAIGRLQSIQTMKSRSQAPTVQKVTHGRPVAVWNSAESDDEVFAASLRNSQSKVAMVSQSRSISMPRASRTQNMDDHCQGEPSMWQTSEDCGGHSAVSCDRIVMRDHNRFRQFWFFCIVLGLIYTSTLFIFKVTFIDFRIPHDEARAKSFDSLSYVDEVVNAIFCIDIVLNFFSSYHCRFGEVTDLKKIAKHYLLGSFIIDFAAAFPWRVLEVKSGSFARLNMSLRLFRLQRLSRLAQVCKVRRFIDAVATRGGATSSLLLQVRGFRGVRIVNFVLCLLIIMHILACGWYLVAAMQDDCQETWVGRRSVGPESDAVPMTALSPFVQWCHSMYFIVAIFTSVGFGDIAGNTTAEVIYASFTMLCGSVINGFIISHVVSIMTSADKVDEVVQAQEKVIQAFTHHTELNRSVKGKIITWLNHNAKTSTVIFDRERTKQTLLGSHMPPVLLDLIPSQLFGGKLIRNRLLCDLRHVQSHLAVELAVSVIRCDFVSGEVIYRMYDRALALFLVLDGTFAHVAQVTTNGGMDIKVFGDMTELREERPYPYQLFSTCSYFGDYELVVPCPRQSSVRCESESGTLLVLPKDDFLNLAAEHAQSGFFWRVQALRRERSRCARLARLSAGKTFRHLAASKIQNFWNALQGKHSRRTLPVMYDSELPPYGGSASPSSRLAQSMLDSLSSIKQDHRRRSHSAPKVRDSLETLQRSVDSLRVDFNQLVHHLSLREGLTASDDLCL